MLVSEPDAPPVRVTLYKTKSPLTALTCHDDMTVTNQLVEPKILFRTEYLQSLGIVCNVLIMLIYRNVSKRYGIAYVAVPGRCISLALLRSKRSSVELPLRAGLICAG